MKPAFPTYLLFLLNGIFPNLFGVVVLKMAADLSVSDVQVGYLFTFFTVSNSISIFIVPLIVDRIGTKKMIYVSIILAIIGVMVLSYSSNTIVFSLGAFIIGFGLGTQFSVSNVILVKNYIPNIRTSKLNIMHFFFSSGAFIAPIFASKFLNLGYSWRFIYRFPFIILILAFIVTFFTSFDDSVSEKNAKKESIFQLPVILVGIAMFSYINSELVIANWLVVYLKKLYNFSVEQGSYLLSIFWISITVGRISTALLIKKIKISSYILLFSIFAVIMFIVVICGTSYNIFIVLMAILGFLFSGIYASIFSYGTSIVENPGGNIISFYLTCGGVGYIVFFGLSGLIISHIGMTAVMFEAAFFMLIIFLSIGTTRVITGTK